MILMDTTLMKMDLMSLGDTMMMMVSTIQEKLINTSLKITLRKKMKKMNLSDSLKEEWTLVKMSMKILNKKSFTLILSRKKR